MSVLQYKLRQILMLNYNCESLTSPAHANCAPQFVELETQCTKSETISLHIKFVSGAYGVDSRRRIPNLFSISSMAALQNSFPLSD